MKIAVDECLPKRLCQVLTGHDAVLVQHLGYSGLSDRDLLDRLEGHVEVFITIDSGVTHQQNLEGRTISIVTLSAVSNTFEALEPLVPRILEVLEELEVATLVRIGSPTSERRSNKRK